MDLTDREKIRFVETAFKKGREAAKADAIKGKTLTIVEGAEIDVFGEKLSAEQVREQYPEALVIELSKEDAEL